MREILFRGKTEETGRWVYGFYTQSCASCCGDSVIEGYKNDYSVNKETVGQYTGLHDSTKWDELTAEEQDQWLNRHTADEWNGKPIFEGDIIKFECPNMEGFDLYVTEGVFSFTGVVTYDNFLFCADRPNEHGGFDSVSLWDMSAKVDYHDAKIKVIGNIHDNPELLGG